MGKTMIMSALSSAEYKLFLELVDKYSLVNTLEVDANAFVGMLKQVLSMNGGCNTDLSTLKKLIKTMVDSDTWRYIKNKVNESCAESDGGMADKCDAITERTLMNNPADEYYMVPKGVMLDVLSVAFGCKLSDAQKTFLLNLDFTNVVAYFNSHCK